MCPGHNAGDLGQGCVVLALMLETVRQHQDGVGLTTPGAHELGPWFEANHGNARGDSAPFAAFRASATSLRCAAGGRPPRAASCNWSAMTRINRSRLSPPGAASQSASANASAALALCAGQSLETLYKRPAIIAPEPGGPFLRPAHCDAASARW